MILIEEILMYENLDLDNLITPVNSDALEAILTQSEYNPEKTKFLVDGFRYGFSLGYEGNERVQIRSPNLKFRIGDETELWNKVMKEVKEKRYAGPFKQIPFSEYIQSPIGLVPKDGGSSTRLIFHLSYPRNNSNTSVNSNTPKGIYCTVKYPDFSKAIKICAETGKGCFCSKSDWKSAFRHFPIQKRFWKFLVMKARNPINKLWYYFVDKCMPFGSSISCAHFQTFSNAIAHIMKTKTGGRDNVNYLDDFLFVAFLRWICNQQVTTFLELCKIINFPVSLDKTVWACKIITFLGMLIDTEKQLIMIPIEKIEKALTQIDKLLLNKKRKATVEQIQKLCGLLNFLCRAIVPGRPFLMRLYASLSGYKRINLKPHHHVKLSWDTIFDLEVWKLFLNMPECFSRPFMDFNGCFEARQIDWFTDSAKALGKGVWWPLER